MYGSAIKCNGYCGDGMMMIVIIHKVSSKSPNCHHAQCFHTWGRGPGGCFFFVFLPSPVLLSASSSSRPVSDFHYLNVPVRANWSLSLDSHPFTQVGSWLPLPTGPFLGTSLRPVVAATPNSDPHSG